MGSRAWHVREKPAGPRRHMVMKSRFSTAAGRRGSGERPCDASGGSGVFFPVRGIKGFSEAVTGMGRRAEGQRQAGLTMPAFFGAFSRPPWNRLTSLS